MTRWTSICPADRLPLERGVAALVDGVQVTVFRSADDTLRAVVTLDEPTEQGLDLAARREDYDVRVDEHGVVQVARTAQALPA